MPAQQRSLGCMDQDHGKKKVGVLQGSCRPHAPYASPERPTPALRLLAHPAAQCTFSSPRNVML
eukprot:361082-Chlamydomonas_euryale.AAC.16